MSTNLNNHEEKRRLLAMYAGIFPDNIKEFSEAMSKNIYKKRKNYSR